MTHNAFACRYSVGLKRVCATFGAIQKFIKPHCPWQNGKVERLNRTLATEWAYRRTFTSNANRAAALAPWLEHYNMADATAHSEDTHRSAVCYQRGGRVHLVGRADGRDQPRSFKSFVRIQPLTELRLSLRGSIIAAR